MAVQRRTGRVITVVILLLACVAILVALINFTNSDKKTVSVGQAAPNFTLADLNDKPLALQDLKGKVVLLNFWGSWCEPCRVEMPSIQSIYERYKDKGVVVVGVNIGENKVTAKGFTDRLGVTFPIILDQDRSVTLDQYHVGPIPTTYFIDKKGIVQDKFEGPMTEQFMTQQIETLLAKP
ncbi:thiol-disulfide oxidoreductase ResA [Effusibacillus dendaii]|uniref:Thiol-disulfide oxidoreductase ResA n=1 Tax=Effusibacillus dendaii TaxID=2743772 RepID=A0A7I8D6R2_9BACL|nr:thiol-disulfide oxidoreductase ResA [Effusibacillus dendaii]BCJ85784.1 thiol-disulfide oxidoreductase ResA [Effusibacillus dendaii]